MRQHVAAVLAAKQEEGVLHLAAPPARGRRGPAALADGLALRMLLDPQRDHRETIAAGVAAVRALVADPA